MAADVPPKIDFALLDFDPQQDQVKRLKSGAELKLEIGENGSRVLDSEGVCLGKVPGGVLDEVPPNLAVECTVRSLKRLSGAVSEILLRVTKRKRNFAQRKRKWMEEDGEDGWQVKQQQYELLVANETLRSMLKDKRLQRALKAIDGADDREKALDEALGNSDFKEFAYNMLDAICPT